MDLVALLKDKDIHFGYEKDHLESALESAATKGVRQENFLVAKGKPIRLGVDASLKFYFKGEDFEKKGFFQKKVSTVAFTAPGDLLLEKILPVEAEDGTDVFREKIQVSKESEAKDIKIKIGENIQELELGVLGNTLDPRRIQYKSETLGILAWKDGLLEVLSTFNFDPEEKYVQLGFASKSDFGSAVTLEMIQNMAAHEGIKVNLEIAEIQKVLRQPRPPGGGIFNVLIAKAIEPKEGVDSQINYLAEFNGKPIDSFLYRKDKNDPIPLSCDCVRPRDVLAVKTPAGVGEDGKSVFGRRIAASRGKDESWLYGSGVDRTDDKLQLYCSLITPGFVMVEGGRIAVKNPVKISKDKMSASISIYPSKNPRFKPSEDKILQMLSGMGVKTGIQKQKIREALEEAMSSEKPLLDGVVAEGKAATRGKDASFYFSIDMGESVGQKRQDGSIDFKNRSTYQNVRAGELLLVKHAPQQGEEGFDVCGNILQPLIGFDARMECREGVRTSDNGLEYRATQDGIVEILEHSIRVMPGLFISEDISFKTGNIEAGNTQVIIKGSVLPDFKVTAERDITVEKVAEACSIATPESIRIRGGIIGREKAYMKAGKDLEALYISTGATVEAAGNITIGSEVLNSKVRAGGFITCVENAGTVCGGEISFFLGMRAKVVGAAGSETQTIIRFGEHYFKQREAEEKIAKLGLDAEIADLDSKAKALAKDLNDIYAQIPEASKTDIARSQRLQEDYKRSFEQRRAFVGSIEKLQLRRQEIVAEVPQNKDASLVVTDLIHPGVTIIYKDVVWQLKEPMRAVEIRWSATTSNLVSKRL